MVLQQNIDALTGSPRSCISIRVRFGSVAKTAHCGVKALHSVDPAKDKDRRVGNECYFSVLTLNQPLEGFFQGAKYARKQPHHACFAFGLIHATFFGNMFDTPFGKIR